MGKLLVNVVSGLHLPAGICTRWSS